MNTRVILVISGLLTFVVVLWLATPGGDTADLEQATAAAAAPQSRVEVSSTPIPAGREPSVTSPAAMPVATPAATLPVSASPLPAPEALPIDVSPGFERLATPASEMKETDAGWVNWRRHQQLQSEPRDQGWSPRIEASLRDEIQGSLMANGADAQRLQLQVLECRTSGCEIQAVGYLEDNRKEGVDLQTILRATLAGNLGTEFDRSQYSITLSRLPGHRTGFLVFLPRSQQ